MSIKSKLTALKFNLKQASPDIMLVAGIALSSIAVFEFCKKTYEAKPIVDDYKRELRVIESKKESESPEVLRNWTVLATKNVCVDLAQTYWQPVLLWSASTGLIIQSHCILKDRNIALAALATGLGTELRTLHQRIIERYGEEADYELKHGIKHEVVEEKRIDEATGSEVTDQKQIAVAPDGHGMGGHSIHARFFDDSSRVWRNDADYNRSALLSIEKECNDILREDGVLFLNQVYRKLDMKPSRIGQKVGWRYYKNPEDNLYGDNYVSFGIYNLHRRANRDFVNGYEPVILLDFNVDGTVIDALPMV